MIWVLLTFVYSHNISVFVVRMNVWNVFLPVFLFAFFFLYLVQRIIHFSSFSLHFLLLQFLVPCKELILCIHFLAKCCWWHNCLLILLLFIVVCSEIFFLDNNHITIFIFYNLFIIICSEIFFLDNNHILYFQSDCKKWDILAFCWNWREETGKGYLDWRELNMGWGGAYGREVSGPNANGDKKKEKKKKLNMGVCIWLCCNLTKCFLVS